ncbi:MULTISPECIES: hypothetical protein [Streptosporangium]|uniref:Uncharacterized protein n=1 Tax=Streptosporangium brasiliense TaxID=47480 RepID=A0ABT9R3D7_9ACTN|nr:hypothetical protein [Streptosporangium brasiliense]MDP9863708.1 hypothetical protein [Streptosporangium brasiliense]
MRKRSFTGVLPASVLAAALLATAPAHAGAAGPAALADAAASPAAAAAAGVKHHWGPVRSAAGHSGHAAADVWITDFSAETFTVSGTLRDRDPHRNHCAYIRARFHYVGGGTGWAQPRSTCRAGDTFRLSSDGEVTRVDVKVCVLDRGRRAISYCHVDAIREEVVANWPR